MTPDQREVATGALEAILRMEGHDLESLSAKFGAERLVELIEQAGFDIIQRQTVGAVLHTDPDR